jgi:hypothetical protein
MTSYRLDLTWDSCATWRAYTHTRFIVRTCGIWHYKIGFFSLVIFQFFSLSLFSIMEQKKTVRKFFSPSLFSKFCMWKQKKNMLHWWQQNVCMRDVGMKYNAQHIQKMSSATGRCCMAFIVYFTLVLVWDSSFVHWNIPLSTFKSRREKYYQFKICGFSRRKSRSH